MTEANEKKNVSANKKRQLVVTEQFANCVRSKFPIVQFKNLSPSPFKSF